MVKYKRQKGKGKQSTPKELDNKPFKRFVEIERTPIDNIFTYVYETMEVLYHTIMPFVAGYFFNSESPLRLMWLAFLLLPLIVRFTYLKKENKTKIYFRL